MEDDEVKFRPLYPLGERKPDPQAFFRPKNRAIASRRERMLKNRGSFIAKPTHSPEKCPLCGTLAKDYRAEHNGEEMLLPGGNPFTCAVCGNTNWNI